MGIINTFQKHETYLHQALTEHKSQPAWQELLAYHTGVLKNFQHERLIHLLVTLRVALINAIFLGWVLFFPNFILVGLNLIFLVMLLFYIRHYFRLENGVQRWYELTRAIRQKYEENNF